MADVNKVIKGMSELPSHLMEAVAPAAYSPQVFYSTAGRFGDKISQANPKMSEFDVMKRAFNQSGKKLDWERVDKPALEHTYGDLAGASFADSAPKRLRNTQDVVAERMRNANDFLDQPTEAWKPPPPQLQAFDRSSIKDALTGFPDVEQSAFPRDTPSRANISHVKELYEDTANRDLIKKQIMRGLPLGGESFYASLYPIKQAVQEAGMPVEKFEQWIHSLAPASARNSIMNEMAVGQFLRNMHAQGIPLTEANVAKGMAGFKEQFGMGLPLMPVHRTGVANVLENNMNLRDMSLANIPTNYKIPTYGTQKAGDFANSAVLDVHEAAGQSMGNRYHPYFTEAGGFGNTEYNAGEQGLLGIAKELGVPGGMAQAGRWFGGGDLTGLRSPRGDALDLLEKQFAYTLHQKGIQPNPANIRAEVLKQIGTGEGDLLPWYKKDPMPDMRTTGLQRKDGGLVNGMVDGGTPPAASMDGDQFFQAAIKAGMSTDIGSLNKIVDLVNKGMSIPEAIEALTGQTHKRDGVRLHKAEGGVAHKQVGGAMGMIERLMAQKAANTATSLAKNRNLFSNAGNRTDELPVGWFPMHDPVVKPSTPQMQNRLSQPEYDANLSRFLEGSTVNHPLYHSTGAKILPDEPLGFSEFNTKGSEYRSEMGSHFGTPEQANAFGDYTGQRILPVHLSVKNPLRLTDQGVFSNRQVGDQLFDLGILSNRDRTRISDRIQSNASANDIQTMYQQHLKGNGIDSIKYLNRHEGVPTESGVDNAVYGHLTDQEFLKKFPMARDSHIIFDPTQVKSAIGNRGTFDARDPNMNRSHGGSVHMAIGGAVHLADGGAAQAQTDTQPEWWHGMLNHSLKSGEIDDLTHALAKTYFENQNG